jgi:hypothetical protein
MIFHDEVKRGHRRSRMHVKSVKVDPRKPGAIDVSYNVIAEIMAAPATPILRRSRNDPVNRVAEGER